MSYLNLPGTTATLIDGNLRQLTADADPVVLILGTASSGFTSSLYTVNEVGVALTEFGRTSEVGKAIVEARDGGATNIVVVRLPGTAPVLSRVGSSHSTAPAGDTGYTVTPVLASTEAATKYGVAYRHAENFIDSLGSVKSELVGRLMVVDLETEQVVWYGDWDTGQAIEDFGLVDVEYDDLDDPSSTDDGESITLAFGGGAAVAGTVSVGLDGYTLPITLAGGETAAAVATAWYNAAILDGALDVYDFADDSSGNITITMSSSGAHVDSEGYHVHQSGHTYEGRRARPMLTAAAVGSTTITITPSLGTGHRRGTNIGVFPADVADAFSDLDGGVFIPINQIATGVEFLDELIGSTDTLLTVTAGDTGSDCSLMERYEKLEEAYELLDFSNFDIVLPQGAILDATNVADLSGSEITSLGLGALSDYPTPGSTKDVLGKLAIYEDCATDTKTYYWDVDADDTAEIASDGTPGGAPATLVYHEVNFAHQLARFCYEASRDFQFCHGIVPTTVPARLTPRGIKEFFGCAPTYTYDSGVEGDVIASAADNGTGLFGHKTVGGRFGYHFDQKYGGLPLTKDGFFDTSNSESNLVKDENGVTVDLGKYVTVAPAFAHLKNEYNNNRASGYLTNLANFIGGRISSLPENVSTTNQTLTAARMRYLMPASLADEAAGFRLTVLINDSGVPTIADGPTFALPSSDFARLTTMRIVAKVIEEMRTASKPYYGKGHSTTKYLSHQTALQGVIQTNITEEMLTSGNFTILQTRAQKVLGQKDLNLSLEPVFEFRRMNIKVSLTVS